MNKKLLMGIIAGIGVVALVLGLVLGLNNCSGTTDPSVDPTPSGTVEPTDDATEKPTKATRPATDPTDPPEPGGISYYSGVPDFTWYDEDEIYEEYTLYTADQFMAFVEMVNGMGVNFQGVTVKLGANMVFNNGDASKWTRDDEELLNWTPIGSKQANPFCGALDGQGHYVSGLYGVRGRDNGFILYAIKATVKNLAIVNSYFCNTGGNQKDAQVLGGVVGRAYGCTLQNLYCDAILEGGGYHTGGIAAFARDTWKLGSEDAKDVLIDSCVFAGTIKGCVGVNVGGILGGTDGVSVKMISNCLNLGSIESTVGSVGGIAGSLSDSTVLMNCVNAGKVVSADTTYDRVALVGKPASSATVKNGYFANIPGAKPFGSGTPTSSGILGVARASMKGAKVASAMPGLDFKTVWTAYQDGYPIPTGVVKMYDALKKDVVEDTGNGGSVWKNETGSTDTGKADTSWYKEGQTSFTLTTADQLYGLAELVNGGKTTFEGVTIKLGADITVNTGDASKWNSSTSGLRAWKAIGASAAKSFRGTLDGQGHYISGLYSRMDRDNGFICYAMNATIKNLGIVNSYFENYGREHSNGYLSAQVLATFVGRSYGSTLQNLYSNARLVTTAESRGYNTGGIAGFAKSNGVQSEIEFGASVIDSCVFAGTITTNNEKDELTGGILGGTDGSEAVVKNCLFRGQINAQGTNIGGIAGRLQNTSVMEDCVSVGNVNSKVALVGAVTGTVEIKDSYYVKITGGKGYVGVPKSATATALERADMKGTGVASVMTGLDFSSKWTALKDDYPIPTGVKALYAAFKQPIPGGESDGAESGGESGGSTHVPGTPDTTWYEEGKTEFTLTTADQLFGFAKLVNEGTPFQGVTVKLGADIVINEGDSSTWGTTAPARVWTPIGSGSATYFAGTFDGQGHYISGVYTAEKENNGLFGWTGNAEIRNLAVINSYFKSVGRDDGKNGQMLATFVARAYGTTLKNLYSNATIHYAVGSDHKGDWCTAGIAGIVTSPAIGKDSETVDGITAVNKGVIDSCVFAGKIITNEANSSTGAAVGGILGSANGKPITIKNCLFVGKIDSNDKQVGGIAGILGNGSTLESCVSVGAMTCTEQTPNIWGAIVGEASGTVSLKNNYYSETLNLPLYGEKSTVNDENTNTELPEAQLRGSQVTTSMNKLTYGADGWTAQENDYPVPTGALAMYLANKEPHVHAWEASWTWNETHHWHNCGNVGCDVTDPAQKDGYGAHVFDNDKDKDCACGYVREIPDSNDGAIDGSLSKPSGYIGGDNSWYKHDSGITEYTLTNVDQLYGLVYLVNVQGYKFEGITIKLGTNMVLNETDASTWATNAPAVVWRPIGTKANYFAGTFDGQGHYISGMYSCEKDNNGMFAWTGNATIKNLAIVNSYFKSTGRDSDGQAQFLGAFAARAYGTVMKNLYTDAIVEYAGTGTKGDWCTGGIAACVTGPSSSAQDGITITKQGSIENCVFAGTILTGTAGGTGSGVGGIMGYSNGKSVIIKNCLYIGSIESNDKNVGGIAGAVANGSTIEACVSAGTLTATVQAPTNWGSVVGEVSGTCSVKNNYYSEALNLPLYGKKGTVNDEATNTALTNAKMKGLQVTTTMANLTFGDKGWTAQEGDYPVPTSMKIMVNALRKLSADAQAPVINKQPTMDDLSVEAESMDGGALSYQWYMSTDGTTFTKIEGATSASYTPDASLTGNVWYKCEVTNTNNNTSSDVKSAKVESNAVKVHTHTEAATMSHDKNGHWYACTVADCDAAVESLPSYQAHSYDGDTDATCNEPACGYERHLHNWNSTWTVNDRYGWHECGNPGCDITEDEGKGGYHEHVFDTSSGNAICSTCSYERVVSVYSGTPDKSWYANNPNANEYVLTHADQLYGLISLVNEDAVSFVGKTIKLAVNIVIAEGDAQTWSKDNAPAYSWTPIGASSNWKDNKFFGGTFDGMNHYISGIYSVRDGNNALFCYTQNATVKNLAIVNSYFEIKATSGNEVLASFVGRGRGVHLENLYSDAILVGGYQQVGGIAGYVQSRKYTDMEARAAYIKNCIFAGSINGGTYQNTGGIVGSDNNGGNTLIQNCLNLGTVTNNATRYTAGIVGKAQNSIDIINCVSVGKVTAASACNGNAFAAYLEWQNPANNEDIVDSKVIIKNSYYITDYNHRVNSGKNGSIEFEQTEVNGIADASAKGTQVTTTMVNLGFGTDGWTARENDYPVPTSILPLLQNVPVNVQRPVINMQPGSFGYENAESTVTPLEITASKSDNGTLTYQWYENSTNSNVGGTPIAGATNPTYTPSLTGMAAGEAKYYYCVVTNTDTTLTGIQDRSVTSDVVCIHIHKVDPANYNGHNATQHWSNCIVDGCGVASGYTNHTGEGKTCSTCGFLKANYYEGGSDKTWYTSDPNASEYVLTTPAQLYGFAELVNSGTTTFKNVTIKLGANMVINDGVAANWASSAPSYSWKPVGDMDASFKRTGRYFAGNLDGQGNFISGFYSSRARDNAFILFAFGGEIKNLAIINSYFENYGTSSGDAQILATFVGRGYDVTLKNLYSDAILKSTAKDYNTGGIAGYVVGTYSTPTVNASGYSGSYPADDSSKTGTVDGCVFAGQIISDTGTPNSLVGGILGGTDGQLAIIKNCLFSGSITSNDNLVGGIAGCVYKAGSEVSNCLVAGTITSTVSGKTVGSVIGQVHNAGDYTITNNYYNSSMSFNSIGKKNNSGANYTDNSAAVAYADMQGTGVLAAGGALERLGSAWTATEGLPIPTGVVIP